MNACPCCSGKSYAHCCGPFISETRLPQTPEELMRSRYTAYTEVKVAYLAHTMLSPALDQFDAQDAAQWAQQVTWQKLEVLATELQESLGVVEYKAHYFYQNQNYILHERSVFRREANKWYYFDGEATRIKVPARVLNKVARNEPCPCGSQKKYKKCCGLEAL